MKKLINNPRAVVDEMIDGLVSIYPGIVRVPGHTVVVRADLPEAAVRTVAVISGGGSGHEPAHAGYVGRGMLSAAVAGDVFTSPSPDAASAPPSRAPARPTVRYVTPGSATSASSAHRAPRPAAPGPPRR